ncbi:MAG: (d)CMP kinase [Hyphomicrobiaceae bacterium]
MIIAIDGPAASGKGTIARRVAEAFGLRHLDTGLLYRAVARDVAEAGFPLDNTEAAVRAALCLDVGSLEDPALKTTGAGEAASVVASIPDVRRALLEYQRKFADAASGAVLDGRDIGTVICPTATVKIFVVADVEERARRRFLELEARGEAVAFNDVLKGLIARDTRDSQRPDSPMRAAADAVLLDTTKLSIDAAVEAAVELIKRKIGRRDGFPIG